MTATNFNKQFSRTNQIKITVTLLLIQKYIGSLFVKAYDILHVLVNQIICGKMRKAYVADEEEELVIYQYKSFIYGYIFNLYLFIQLVKSGR